jgi:hypothetical protein
MTDTNANPNAANSNTPPSKFKQVVAKIIAFFAALFAKAKAKVWVKALWQRFFAKS